MLQSPWDEEDAGMQKSNDNADSALWLKMRETAERMMRAGKPAAEAKEALIEIMQDHFDPATKPLASSSPRPTKTNH